MISIKHLISVEEFKKGMAQVETIYKDKIHDLSKDPENKVKVEVVPELPEDPAVTKNQMDSFLKSIGFKTPEELKTERQKVADLVLPGPRHSFPGTGCIGPATGTIEPAQA
jgi:hypothetical protein